MKLTEIIRILEDIAPPELAVRDDRIGLQIGDPGQDVRRVVVTVDVTPQVVNKAIQDQADLIIAHHPLIHQPLASIRLDVHPQTLVYSLINAGTSLYVMHTNYDSAPGGINDVLAERLGVVDTTVLEPVHGESRFKLTTFVPPEALEGVLNAIAEAGAGVIGNYSHCSFRVSGTGTFKPMPGAEPYTGKVGELEQVEEFRLEVLVPECHLNDAISAMTRAHPYEEVAYDVYPLWNKGEEVGLGRYGTIEAPVSFRDFCRHVCDTLGVEDSRISGDPDARIEKVAVLGGGGGDRVSLAHSKGVDVFVTGDVNHHQFLLAQALGLNVIDATHFRTERPGMIALAPRLHDLLSPHGVTVEYADDVTLGGG